MTPSIQKEHTLLEKPEFVFLVFLWGIGVMILSSPLADSFSFLQKVRYLAPAMIVSSLLVLVNLQDGLTFWAMGLTLLMMGTGYQFNVGPVRTSALEIMLVVLLTLLLWNRRSPDVRTKATLHVPEQGWLFAFLLFSIAVFVLSIIRGIPITRAVIQFKGFVLYPLFAYIMIAGIQSRKTLYIVMALAFGAALVIAGLGILDFTANYVSPTNPYAIYRSSGQYGPTNLYGLTLAAITLLLAGLGLGSDKRKLHLLTLAAVLWLLAGAVTSISRTMGSAFLVGGLYLLSLKSLKRSFLFIIIGIGSIALLALFPNAVSARLFQLSDSSFQKRVENVKLGLQIVATYPLGTGWGQGYILHSGNLVPSGLIPWHHNDYLNLAVQTGIPGLIIYLIFWGKVFIAGRHWLNLHSVQSDLASVVQGAQAAMAALLVGAVFEHALWRPDIAGLVGWMLGIMVAAMRLHEREHEEAYA